MGFPQKPQHSEPAARWWRMRPYDHAWNKVSREHRARNAVCEFCASMMNVVRPSELTNHRFPLQHGGARLDKRNLQALCADCHYAITAKEELHARGKPVFWGFAPDGTPREDNGGVSVLESGEDPWWLDEPAEEAVARWRRDRSFRPGPA